jgi:MoxR-like ATPase
VGSSAVSDVEAGSDVEAALPQVTDEIERLRKALGLELLGQEAVVEQVIWALLAGGHALLEGAPGLGKTLLVQSLARLVGLDFSRIQFTPDLMPSDITGSEVLLLDDRGSSSGKFALHKGPIFAHVVLADEINRASPKTQSALLEVMQDAAVTIGGQRYPMPGPFIVLGTQNPIEMEGTYPLPEAQLDRFLLKILVMAPELEQFEAILMATSTLARPALEPLMDKQQLARLQAWCQQIVVPRAVVRYAALLCTATRPDSELATPSVKKHSRLGVSVRAGMAVISAAKARALAAGRLQAAFDDVRAVLPAALRHRLLVNFEGQALGVTPDLMLEELLDRVSPRLLESSFAERGR